MWGLDTPRLARFFSYWIILFLGSQNDGVGMWFMHSQVMKKSSISSRKGDLAGMQELFGEILVPTEEVVEMKAGQNVKVKNFFPVMLFHLDGA